MCGILALLGKSNADGANRFSDALDTLTHRGPDGRGIWVGDMAMLGHRRLSILDLTDASSQPMQDPDSGKILIFNGEIYNYVELRAELTSLGHSFRTTGDTEVLLKSLIQWGEGALNRLNGMWAFLLWDPRLRVAMMSRDRFGVKPLYYSLSNHGIAIASEPKALHKLDPRLCEYAMDGVTKFFVDTKIHHGERTLFEKIRCLPPAHFGVFDAYSGICRLWRYWDYPAGAPARSSLADQAQEFSALLEQAVSVRLRSDVPVGLTLSGGIDSTSILATAAAQLHTPLRCYTSVYSKTQRGEEPWAHLAASSAGCSLKSVTASPDDWLALLTRATHHLDAPGYSPAVLPLWNLMHRARQDAVPVLLEGQGADELFGGYPQYAATEFIDALHTLRVSNATYSVINLFGAYGASSAIAWIGREAVPALHSLLNRESRVAMLSPELRRNHLHRNDTGPPVEPDYPATFRRLWRDHFSDVLPALLHYGDAISMAHGIESRLPFLDFRLVEWVFRTQPTLFHKGQNKVLLRRHLSQLGFRRIAERRDKQGYSMPMGSWFGQVGRQHLRDLISSPNARIWDALHRPTVARRFGNRDQLSASALFLLYKIISLHTWMTVIAQRRLDG